MTRKVLILSDGKAGHENQSRALARSLGAEAQIASVRFASPLCKAASYALDRLGVATERLFAGGLPDDPGCDAVIGAGSGVFYAVKTCARRWGKPGVAVLYPRGYRLDGFAAVLAPFFDRPRRAPAVVEIPANLVAQDPSFYAEGESHFAAHYRSQTGRELDVAIPSTAVIVGGPNACARMDATWMRRELDRLFAAAAAGAIPGRMWVTTSRRTPPEVEAVIDSYSWDYRLIYSRDRFNPIPGFVAVAQRLCVTAESTGMLSEVCTCGGAYVEAIDDLLPGDHKFRRFLAGLKAAGYVDGARKIDLGGVVGRVRELLHW